MFHEELVWLTAEAVDLEPSQGQHLVVVLSIVDRNEAAEELLLAFEVAGH
jgi:hypothetical protein